MRIFFCLTKKINKKIRGNFMKNFKIGKINIDTKSMLIGLVMFALGLSVPQTKSFFTKIWTSVQSVVNSVLGKK